MTRAKAAEVAEKLHMDESALLELNSHDDRTVLSPTSISGDAEAQFGNTTTTIPEKRTSKKRTQKGKKKTNPLNASAISAAPDHGPDEIQVAQSSDDLVKDIPECECEALLSTPAITAPFGPHNANAGVAVEASHLPVHDIRPTTPPSNAVRLTRSQLLRKTSSDLSSASQNVSQTNNALGVSGLVGHTDAENLVSEVSSVEPPVSNSPEIMPNVLEAQFPTPTRLLGAAKPELAGMENVDPNGAYDQLEKAVVKASTPPRPNSISPMIPATAYKPTYDQLEAAKLSASKSARSPVSAMLPDDPIEALDAQDEAVEKIAAEVPDVQDSPQKVQTKKSMPPVRLTKASQARISLAHGLPDAPSKAPAMGRPRQSMSQSTSKRITSTSSAKLGADAADQAPAVKKEVIIPHSKPRPMSMQFKPPPPPARSTKAPTQSNFQLPGEAVAAKFKAAREARQQKEAEEQKKKAFKARPAPNMNKTPTVRQTSTSKARESIMNPGRPLAASVGASRPMSVATSRPATTGRPTTSSSVTSSRPSTAPKPSTARMSIAPSKTKDIAVKKRPISMMASSTSKARPATVLGVNSRPRTLLAPKPNPPAAESVRPTFQAGKGKEVFNRAAEATATAEQQKRGKEEAAKKARLEASERSRQLSRDWAEKQCVKKLASIAPAGGLTT